MKAVLFPGQGAQYPNMGLGLYQSYSKSKEVFNAVDRISGIAVTEAIFSQEVERLKDTSLQQLAILAVSLAAYRQIEDKLNIDYVSGLSLGEYSCLYAVGALSLDDVILLVEARAKAMQKAAEKSSSSMFAVIGASEESIRLKQKDSNFYVANLNAPSQVVISVGQEKKEIVKDSLETEGWRVVELEVSGGFHSPFMRPAENELREALDRVNFSDAKVPIVSNVTASAHTKSSQIKENLLLQLVSPVLWMKSVLYMAEKGVNSFYEVGPSRVLKGIIRKIDKSLKVSNIESKEDIESLSSNACK